MYQTQISIDIGSLLSIYETNNYSAQSSVYPYGLSQESDIPHASDVSLPTVHDKTQESSLRFDFSVGYGVPSSSNSNLPYIFSE